MLLWRYNYYGDSWNRTSVAMMQTPRNAIILYPLLTSSDKIGFEPMVPGRHIHFQGEHIRPLCHLSLWTLYKVIYLCIYVFLYVHSLSLYYKVLCIYYRQSLISHIKCIRDI